MAVAQVSHEGNPPETPASLTVSGTLDGTVTLAIQFTPADPESEDGPRPLPPEVGLGGVGGDEIQITCGDVFAWDTERGDGQPIQWGAAPCNNNVGDITRSYDVDSEITITTFPICYGIILSTVPGAEAPEQITFLSTFKELVSGQPIAGPCLIGSSTSADNVTCLAIAVDWSTGITYFLQYENASLNSIANATVLYSASYTPTVGDLFYLSSIQDAAFENTVTAKIYSVGNFGGTVQWGADITLELTNNNKAGFIAIGSNGRAVFGSSANKTCHNSLALFAYSDEDFA